MRVFLSESLCCGGWREEILPPSLAAEGRSMLLAVADDLSRDGTIEVLTTWDARLPPPVWPVGVRAETVASWEEEQRLARRLVAEADAVWIIAPECGGLLAERVAEVVAAGKRGLNCSPEAIELCGDKLRLSEWLSRQSIPTPRTIAWDRNAVPHADGLQFSGDRQVAWPVVVKPRDGAGSQSTALVTSPRPLAGGRFSWEEWQQEAERIPWPGGWIVQPFVPGRPLSVAAIVRSPTDFDLLPVGQQTLSSDGRFAYEGGRIPAADVPQPAIHQFVRSVVEAIPGLFGWVGFDLILPDRPDEPPVLIEINPRLCTSYIGYRPLTETNLARRIASPGPPLSPITFSGEIEFTPAGDVLRQPWAASASAER